MIERILDFLESGYKSTLIVGSNGQLSYSNALFLTFAAHKMMDQKGNIFPIFDEILSREEKEKLLNQKACVLWLTGLSGSGKTTIAKWVESALHSKGFLTQLLDGDNIRTGISNNLAFSEEDRIENIRRISEVSKLFVNSGVITINCFVSPTKEIRNLAKEIIGDKDFFEIFINTSLALCEERDVKGLYAKARKGEIKDFTGINAPYENPETPALEIRTNNKSIESCGADILNFILPKIKKKLMKSYSLTHLKELESESIFAIREVAAQFDNPVMLFSGGKDSIVMFHLARKAFFPAKIPFPLMHIDTGHNFPETIEFRDRLIEETGANLIIGSVQDSIDQGQAVEEKGMSASRNALQTVTLLESIEHYKFDAAMGGGRRDEEKARAKERFFSHRDEFGQWDPKNQRPELWNLFNGRKNIGEQFRVFPISNWTQMDVWQYILSENIDIPSLYLSHKRMVVERDGVLLASSDFLPLKSGELITERQVRFRTIGDMTCTGAVESFADNLEKIIEEVAATRVTERGGRSDDKRSEAADGGSKKRGLFLKPREKKMSKELTSYLEMDLLRFTTAGSVDDGKSTLIGRMLYDSKSIFKDQMEAIERVSKKSGDQEVNLALLTDGLRAEREQGITIDVAYRYFATPRRKFIIADTPGHIQYTRNMVTGASTANLAIILVDARHGVVEQTKRHSFIASLLGIPHIIYCINKMDLVNYDESVFETIRKDLEAFTSKLTVKDIHFIPICALRGDNIVKKSDNMDWYGGSTLMYTLENVHISGDHNHVDCRFPVQYVIRPQSTEYPDYRGFAGRVAGGIFKKGDDVLLLPSGFTTKIKSIDSMDGEVEEAFAPMSVTITLEDDFDLSRGDMIVRENNQPKVSQDIQIMLCWMHEQALSSGAKFILRQTTQEMKCILKDINYKVNVNTLHRDEEDINIGMNDIARVTLRSTKPIFFDRYDRNRITGSVILIKEGTNETVGAGMII